MTTERNVYNCKYLDYEEYDEVDDEVRVYNCTHPDAPPRRWGTKSECVYNGSWNDNAVDACKLYEES